MTEQTEVVVNVAKKSEKLFKVLIAVVAVVVGSCIFGFVANRATIDEHQERLDHLERRVDIMTKQMTGAR